MTRERLDDHRRIWSEKPVLGGVYEPWFDLLLEQAGPAQRVLEIGAGPGFLGGHARRRRPDLRWIDAMTQPLAPLTAMRALLTWEKITAGNIPPA